MSKYNFYNDESENSRKINYKTVSAANYYDNFGTMIVGQSDENDDILQRHASFETKYADRKDRNGEIKSTMFQQKQFKYGFTSLNKQNAQFVNDVLSLCDEDIHIYFSVSKLTRYFNQRRCKLPIEPVNSFDEDSYLNQREKGIF